MTVAPSPPAPAPPPGFRPHMPLRVVLEAAIRQSRCPDCGKPLGRLEDVQRDHSPPLQMRAYDAEAGDTIPPANDPAHIVLRHKDCHGVKTAGRPTKARAEGDVTEIARTKRLADEQAEFRRRVLAKEPGQKRERKSKIKSPPLRGRGFPKRDAS